MSPHLSYTLYKLIGHTFPLFSQSTKLKEKEASEIFLLHFQIFLPTSNLWRETNEEKRALDRAQNDMYSDVRQAAEAHRQVMRPDSHCRAWVYKTSGKVNYTWHYDNNTSLLW